MNVSVLQRTPRHEADAVASANYEALKVPVVRAVKGKLWSSRVRLDRSDFDEAYNMGWHGVCRYIAQGHEVTNLTGLLVKITYERSLDIYRQRQEHQFLEHDLEERVVEDDLAERLDDEIKLQRLITRLKERLNEAERQAVTLCVLHGFKRPEAAQALGIPEERIQKIMDSATKKIAGVVAGIETRGCGGAEWSRLLRAYALGALEESDRDYERALVHVEDCATCRRYVMGLRGLAGVLPPLALPLAPTLSGAHDAGILTHLYRVFAPGHGATTAAGTATVVQTTGSAAAPTIAGSGGVAGGLLSGGAGIKTAAVVVVAALSAATVHVIAVQHPHHHSAGGRRQDARATITGAAIPIAPSMTSQVAERAHAASAGSQPDHGQAKRSTASGVISGPARATAREFGFEHPSRTRVDATAASASVASTATSSSSGSSQVQRSAAPSQSGAAASKEFGFEQGSAK